MRPLPCLLSAAITCAGLLALVPGCHRVEEEPTVFGPLPLPADRQSNQLADAPTDFLRRQANSPIRWQNWTPGITEAADESKRLIFVFVGSSLYPASQAALDTLAGSPRITGIINERFLPVIADVDTARELSLAAHLLASEIRRPISFPFLLWLSPEGNPVAWTPISDSDPEAVIDLFDQSSNMVDSMWAEAPAYVIENSARDAELRRTRMLRPDPETTTDPGTAVRSAARRVCDLFDPSSGHIDGTGGLPPAGVYDLLALVGSSPAVDDDLRADCREVLRTSGLKLVHSSMFDPLDGGIYLARRGVDWNLPVFTRDTTTQLRMATALVEMSRCTGDQTFLDAARATLRFAEAGLGTAEGRLIHSISVPPEHEPSMLWTREDLEHHLDPAELQSLVRLMDITGLGNVPFDSDPVRRFFRLNVLGMRHPPGETAESLGITTAELQSQLESAARKLLKARNQRIEGRQSTESTCFARHLARAASVNAAMFAATGDAAFRDRALAHLGRLRNDYYDETAGLRQLARTAEASQQAARTHDYALTAAACLDLHSITLDSSWIRWAESLVEEVNDKMLADDRLLECAPAHAAITLQVTDSTMVFDDSSAGLLHAVITRLSAFLPSPPPGLATALRRAIGDFDKRPIVHTDALTGEFTRRLAPVVHIAPGFGGDDPAAALTTAIRITGPRRLTIVPVAAGFPSPAGLPDRGALLSLDGRPPLTFSTPAELTSWLQDHFQPHVTD